MDEIDEIDEIDVIYETDDIDASYAMDVDYAEDMTDKKRLRGDVLIDTIASLIWHTPSTHSE